MKIITPTMLNELAERYFESERNQMLARLGKTEADRHPLTLVRLLEINGVHDALWCIDRMWPEKLRIKMACRFAREVERQMPQASKDALAVFERYTDGGVSEEEFQAAAASAKSIAEAAMYAADAADARATPEAKSAYIACAASYAAAHAGRAETNECAICATDAVTADVAADVIAYSFASGSSREKQANLIREFIIKIAFESCYEGGAA